ncbi:MAG TPA: 3-hydroxyacyl-CoA dehydrogenase family protein [Anaerohalosphaeraceae bacterium]|nr:3-hydroxyacyl-CoA dehydrogenase family protein [Anaerohalosphaeraceae bacterium]HOM76688.1 3-hydroxyacyl-CoA dehydrogenase family protein [Anaerohalosphaeraceae bacterium]HPC64127.1 3-hydroxyacyl-CoA dehydrogenase family protein [Anaerohalosphaeraceae bacterium]HPO70295.1 3-hydroxyacyl-CoA dehydrogenase family protein [Anaerohalosphaeraceae bacterium]HRS71495.1 3-hydroxyacyl-CoA dehydrogenase family protein [Anaerohalosphaeraceae bacterium]
MKIETVLILGASGTIGSLTGGLLAQNGIKIFFLSRTSAGSLKGLARAQKQARSETIAKHITCGDYEGLLPDACRQADWIIECVAEDYSIKQGLYERVDNLRRPDAIVSSVTSSLLLDELPKGRSASFRRHFLSTHFYNPPGKMTACEICGTSETDPAVVDFISDFCSSKLRRAVIRVKPTAGFAGNRLAFVLFARITELAAEFSVEMMDYLIGPYTGRLMPPLATLDLVGLDIHKAIIHSLAAHTDDAFHHKLVLPAYIEKMIETGHLGNKTRDKGGFYKKLESGDFMYIDPATGSYIPSFHPHVRFVETAKDQIHLAKYRQAFDTIVAAKGTEADIVREILATYIAYGYMLAGEVTDAEYGITGIDRVMSTGFNWASPSLMVYMLGGKDRAMELIKMQKLPVPELLRTDDTCEHYIFNAGKYFPAK